MSMDGPKAVLSYSNKTALPRLLIEEKVCSGLTGSESETLIAMTRNMASGRQVWNWRQ